MEKGDLEKMSVTELREEALKHPDRIKGADEMEKEQLISALTEVLGIAEPGKEEKPAADRRARKPTCSKAEVKGRIRALKEERRKAYEEGNYKAATLLRRRIHSLKHLTRKVAAAK
ncbi:MAG: hypothetical protein ACE5JS_11155 [Nitrospinota bacterium]